MKNNPFHETISGVFEIKLKDYFLTQEEFIIRKNQTFGFLETYPQPIDNLARYYESEAYISHSDSTKGLFARLYQFVKFINLRRKFSMLDTPKKNAKILDYGCGTGDFLAYAKNKKLNVLGVEPNLKARQIAAQKIGKENVLSSDLNEIHQTFDIITLWHVLEHIPNIFEFLEELKNHLKPGGEIIIAVPNHLSYDAKFYKEFWAGYDVPRHLWHFSPESMQKLLQRFGMKIEKTQPLWFDSFYVSLLSERYKKTKLGFIRAVWVGALSNIMGVFSKNYSSVVYKVRKIKN